MDKSKLKKMKPIILLILVMILVCFGVYAACDPERTGGREVNVEGDIRLAVERHLKESAADIRDFVEHAHRTVTVRKKAPLELVKCRTVTSDGSDRVHPDLSNLKHVEIEVRAVWDGWFHKGGETIVAYQLLPEPDCKLRTTPFQDLRTTP